MLGRPWWMPRWLWRLLQQEERQNRALAELAAQLAKVADAALALRRALDLLQSRVKDLEDALLDPIVGIRIVATPRGPGAATPGEEDFIMASSITDEQTLGLVVVGVTAGGKIKPAPTPIAWTADAAIGTVSPADQPSAVLHPPVLDAPASGSVSVTAGAFSASEAVTVNPAPVVGVQIQASPVGP